MPLMFDYQRELMIEAAALNPGTAEGGRAAWWLATVPVTDGGGGWVYGAMRQNFEYRYDVLAAAQAAQASQAPTALVYDGTGVGALFARSSWDKTASWLAAVAGPYDQSHAHQEQGGFTFFKGSWLAVTSNILSNSGVQQGVEGNNVLRFVSGGANIPQNDGTSTMTYTDSGDQLQVVENLAAAYSSHASQVLAWKRTLGYTRSAHRLQVVDTCTVASGVQPVFQVNVPTKPTVSGGSAVASGLTITPTVPAGAVINVVDMHALNSDYGSGYRVDISYPSGVSGCAFTVNLQAQ